MKTLRQTPLGQNNLTRTFGKESKLDSLQAMLAKYDLKVSILDVTGTVVQIADCSYSDWIVARSVLAEKGYSIVKG
jgi:hypothetical protein